MDDDIEQYDDSECCERCGHFHSDGPCPDPQQPCGDYRCCIN